MRTTRVNATAALARSTIPISIKDRWWRILKIVLTIAVVAGCVLVSPITSANCIDGKQMAGVNLSGAEFASEKLPGTLFKDYVYPDLADMRYFKTLGMNTFRLPFLWERIQPQLFGALDQAELQRIVDTVSAGRSIGACVILDVHNYGEYRGQPIGSVQVPRAALSDLWVRLLPSFKDPTNVAFDLMNEPSKISIGSWVITAQETINALRRSGAKNMILVAGGGWSGAHSWFSKEGGISNAEGFKTFHDPANNYMIEAHQYADSNFSGTHTNCIEPERLTKIMVDLTQWGVLTGQRLFLGEFGVSANAQCLDALTAMVEKMKGSLVWGGWTYWSAGKWLGSYPLSIHPDSNGDKPQIAILKNGM
ncbi:glycoside hydrolase family 5 protein [Glaciimonas sp. GNP009]